MVVNIWKTWLFRGVLLVLFAALLVYILFLANGYQYDSYSHQIRKTGIIQITYSDTQAKVFLDGNKLEGTLPFVASNVLPGVYNLIIGREGYFDYFRKVRVDEDLISVVGSAFLYPIDVLAASRLQMDWDQKGNNTILADGYVFRQTKDRLFWSKLRIDFDEKTMRDAQVKDLIISKVVVMGKEALLQYADGSRQILDMFGGEVSDVKIDGQYVFAGDRWFYFQNNWLSAFDRNLGKVLWVKSLGAGELINAVYFWDINNRQFLAVQLKGGAGRGYLYELKGDNLVQLLEGDVADLHSDSQNNLYFLENSAEIWRWLDKAKEPQLLARFQNPVSLWSVDLSFYKNAGLVLFEEGQKFYLADQNFDNVREMFPHLNVGQLQVVDRNKIFFVDGFKKTSDGVEADRQRLLVLALEQ